MLTGADTVEVLAPVMVCGLCLQAECGIEWDKILVICLTEIFL